MPGIRLIGLIGPIGMIGMIGMIASRMAIRRRSETTLGGAASIVPPRSAGASPGECLAPQFSCSYNE
ncbi:hypothetical protein B7R21_02155 [Subtercola boreus]|uniref:Uncharacterized protein n=1 Tax=Subtercola boreus TaxID=120213 RepID=A0A3E0W372_9MICO|nr:hypothetical protein B7R21_02155 [Subtercola boreus]